MLWPSKYSKMHFQLVNSALHPSGVAKSSTSFGWGKGGKVASAGWQVTLCDPIWHVISRSGEVISITNCYIRVYFTLLYFTFTQPRTPLGAHYAPQVPYSAGERTPLPIPYPTAPHLAPSGTQLPVSYLTPLHCRFSRLLRLPLGAFGTSNWRVGGHCPQIFLSRTVLLPES